MDRTTVPIGIHGIAGTGIVGIGDRHTIGITIRSTTAGMAASDIIRASHRSTTRITHITDRSIHRVAVTARMSPPAESQAGSVV